MRENRYNGCDDWYFAGVKELDTLVKSGVFATEMELSSHDWWTSTFKEDKVWACFGSGGKYRAILGDEGADRSSAVLIRAF